MGQKANPIIFRSNSKNTNWNVNYESGNREESNFLLVLDLKIKHFLNRVLKMNGFVMCYCNTQYTYNQLCVNISYLNTDYKRNVKLPDLKKLILLNFNLSLKHFKYLKIKLNFKKIKNTKQNTIILTKLKTTLRRLSFNPIFEHIAKSVVFSISEKNGSKLLADTLAMKLVRIKEQNKIFFMLKSILLTLIKTNEFDVKGVKIIFNGRFGKAPRARKRILTIGSVALQTIKSNIDYSQSVCYTPNGTLGISVFINKK